MRSARWRDTDYYAVLGVRPEASDDEIAHTFRELAKQLHPDREPSAAEQFKRLSAAYSVLRTSRREYDDARRSATMASRNGTGPAGNGSATARPRHVLVTRRHGLWAFCSGIALIVLGLGAVAVELSVHAADAARVRGTQPATAQRVRVGGRTQLEFRTTTGRLVHASEPGGRVDDSSGLDRTVRIRYHPSHPTGVVEVEDHAARDITLWLVAGKLLIAGAIFLVLGRRRLRAP